MGGDLIYSSETSTQTEEPMQEDIGTSGTKPDEDEYDRHILPSNWRISSEDIQTSWTIPKK